MKSFYLALAMILIAMKPATAQKFTVAEVERELLVGSNQLNQKLPMWINKWVRLDTSHVGAGLRFTYIATVMDPSPGVPTSIEELKLNRVIPGICNDPNRRELLMNGVTFVYAYRRQDLRPLASKSVSARDCGLRPYR